MSQLQGRGLFVRSISRYALAQTRRVRLPMSYETLT